MILSRYRNTAIPLRVCVPHLGRHITHRLSSHPSTGQASEYLSAPPAVYGLRTAPAVWGSRALLWEALSYPRSDMCCLRSWASGRTPASLALLFVTMRPETVRQTLYVS